MRGSEGARERGSEGAREKRVPPGVAMAIAVAAVGRGGIGA